MSELSPVRALAALGHGGGPQDAPGPGCTVDELRSYIIKAIKDVDKEATDLEGRVATQINRLEGELIRVRYKSVEMEKEMAKVDSFFSRIDDLEKSMGAMDQLRKDVGVFSTIKPFVTQEQLDARMAQVDQFVLTLDNHLKQLGELESQFIWHVEHNFTAVEK
jgi:hypothetical protein